jgi:predicted dehydrogenase
LRAACGRYAVHHACGDWRELVESDAVHAVAICTPNDTHASIALAALRNGKPPSAQPAKTGFLP